MDFFRQIKWFFQRGTRGWADCDAWDAYTYLADLIPAMMKELKKGSGCPSPFFNDMAETGENPCIEWHKVLDEISLGFQAARDLDHYMYRKFVKTEEGNERMGHDYESQENLIKQMRKGLDLFAKYYINLWD